MWSSAVALFTHVENRLSSRAMSERIDDKNFAKVVRYAPLVSIDLLLRAPGGRIFVGWRTNEPAKGVYFVPGGVVRKGELLDDAFRRILTTETGLTSERSSARFLGVYEHFYPTNRYDDPAYGTHYVVLGYELAVPQPSTIRLDAQHNKFRWLSEGELLTAPDVHENTKAYLTRRPAI